MSEIINARGLACPQPVILTKKALETNDKITVLVDNTTAVENIKRLATSVGCSLDVVTEEGGAFRIELLKKPGASLEIAVQPEYLPCDINDKPAAGPTVFVISSDTMGRGNEDLGRILMKAFIHTAIDLDSPPHVMIFYNTGVRLAAEGSDVLDDLKNLEEKGVKILVCGTCVNFFELTGKVSAGIVSNMYDIAGTMSSAGRIVQP
jgi:selenium metabolism protein YedF